MNNTLNSTNTPTNTAPIGTGPVYTTNNTGNWSVQSGTSPTSLFNNSNGKPIMTIPHGKNELVLESSSTLEVKGRVTINGRDLEERLNTIEKVLAIPEKDVILEKKHPKLKQLYDDYIAALGKYRTFEAIKDSK